MIRKNVLLKKRLGCLLVAALLAGEISSASMVALAAPIQNAQTTTEGQESESAKTVEIPEKYITFGETMLTEPDVETLDCAKAQQDEKIQTQIPILKADTKEETLDTAKSAEVENTKEENETELSQETETVTQPEAVPAPEPSMPEQPTTGGNVSDVEISYIDIQPNEILSGEGHNGVFETRYFSFTPEESGYYGFENLELNGINLYTAMSVKQSDGTSSFHSQHSHYAQSTFSCIYLEAGVTYQMAMQNNWVSTEYSYEIKFLSFDEVELSEESTTSTVKQRTVLKTDKTNALFRVKIESANDFDYKLYVNNNSNEFVVLENGVENIFFSMGSSTLCLIKDVDVEDEVTITLEEISATEYDLTNASQEMKVYRSKKNIGNVDGYQDYSFFSLTPNEAGNYTVVQEDVTSINIYIYNEMTQQLEVGWVSCIGSFNGYSMSLEAGKTYYFLAHVSNQNSMFEDAVEDKTLEIKKQEPVKQQIGTAVTYSGNNILSLSFDTEAGKFYKVTVNKSLEDLYYYQLFGNTFMAGNSSINDKKSVIYCYGCTDEMSILLSKAEKFENTGDITVKIEECTIPEIKKDSLISNTNSLLTNEMYITKFIPEETGVYEITGIRYDSDMGIGYIYEEVETTEYVMGGLSQISGMPFVDSSFYAQVSLNAGTTYYIVTYGSAQTEPNDICFYISDPKNYQMDLSQEDTTSLSMELLKAANVSVTVPQSGFYELNISGDEELYQVSSSQEDTNLVIYKEQPKTVYFETPGTYTFTVSREFLPEDTLEQLIFSVKKTSEIENMPVYDGTTATEKEITLRESGDYTWLSVTPQEDGYYTFSDNSYEEDYGSYNKYIYELKEDYLEYILYTNNMYELEADKTYYIKVYTHNMNGANKHLILLKNAKTDLELNTNQTVGTYYGVVANTNIEEDGIYKLTLKSNVAARKMRLYANGSTYTLNVKKDRAVSITMYLTKGEQELVINRSNVSTDETGLELKLEKENVQDNIQNITMDDTTVWVKYTPTESQQNVFGTKGVSEEESLEFELFYQNEEGLVSDFAPYDYINSDFYGVYEFKKDVTYYFKIDAYEVPKQFCMYIEPVQQQMAENFENISVEVGICTQIDFEQEVTDRYYELKLSKNATPLRTNMKFVSEYGSTDYVNSFSENGASCII